MLLRGSKSYLRRSHRVPGWTRGDEAVALLAVSQAMPDDATIVEIGSFLGSGTILLAGSRKLRGSGKVHAVDPFDGSGDAYSVPFYAEIIAKNPLRTQREHFDHAIAEAGLTGWVEAHQGGATEIAATWTTPIDLLFLDGDQSPAGVRAAFEAWEPWLKNGGVIALHNSNPRDYDPDHDGHYRLAVEDIVPPRFRRKVLMASTTFARKARK